MLPFLLTHWYMVLIALASGLFLCWPLLAGRAGGSQQLEPQAAVQLMNRKQALLLDVREEKIRVAEGLCVTQARAIPGAELEGRLPELKKFQNKPVIVQCGSGRNPAAICALLQKNGFSDVYALAGGIAAWQKAGLPVQRISAA